MSRLPNWRFLTVLSITLVFAGCATSTSPTNTPPDLPSDTDHATHGDTADPSSAESHKGHEHPVAASPEIEKALSQLSHDDRMAAEKQKTCPVSTEALGSMGKPYKVTINDRDVFLCCQGCEEKLRGDPDKYLAKISE
ncbi:MAG: hypothetical protein H8E44_39850 [Planctomycetes bacterium]|nr:hypothetical protein [Planctomycetota bacterium]MBL7042014.1 hypothetical protein [Pirellulaceae bacterium]